MSKHRDRLDGEFRHLLRRCPKLEDAECRLLSILGSYEHGCLLTYEKICLLTGFKDRKPRLWSRSKLIRTINSLEKKGLIVKKHRQYKRTTIKIAPAALQISFASSSDVSPMKHESWVSGETTICHPGHSDVPPMTHSILEKELKRKKEESNLENMEESKIKLNKLIKETFPNWGR